MKKYVVSFILILLLAPCVGAQTFKRTAKTPGFFIPKGALQAKGRSEKLPPVEKMNYRGQPAQIVIDLQHQAQEKAKQEELEKQKQEALAKFKREQEIKKNEQHISSGNQKNNNTESVHSASITNTAENTKEKLSNEIAQKQNKIAPTPENGQEINIKLIKTSPEDETKFEQIIDEYRSDILAISNGTPTRNQRLIDMIADYTDTDRSI
ncbi:MAG: hypothetical protein IJ677_06600 [Alphaproteobacteria bacterium]|nr:hypothetical protein [Alphaproteobacteria bacterium]